MLRVATAALGVALWLVLGAAPARGQTGIVEGQVSASGTGAPIANAQVSVVGTSLGTRTDAEGRFVLLNVPAGMRELRVLAIGYKVGTLRLEVRADTRAPADFALTASVLSLDEVVVTGTAGQARVREVGNSIAQINIADVKDPPASMDQLLQARAPGLQVMETTGSSGGGAQIRLRGAVSVSQSNQPIVYVDGVRVRSEGYRRNRPPVEGGGSFRGANYQASPLNDVNPADVERVEVIRGSAASTLYGTEAAAGVIQIFTKRGRRGVPRWTFQLDQGFARELSFGTDANPYMNFRPKDGANGQCHDRVRAGETDSTSLAGCSWLRNGHRQKFFGSVTGGSDFVQYFISGSWEDHEGVLPLDNERQLSTRGNFSVSLLDNLRFDWNSSYSRTRVLNTPSGNNAQGLTLNVYRAERNYRQTNNPVVLDSLLDHDLTTEIDRFVTGGSVYYSPLPWFSNRFTLGYDLAQQENRNLRPFGFVSQPTGILVDEQHRYSILTADYAGNMDYRLTPTLNGTFSFGAQSITSEEVRTSAYGERFPGPGNPTVDNAALYLASEGRLRVVNAGFFFQNVFKHKERYFLTGGVRFDGNSAFGKSLGLQAYPKASFSYILSEEPFWPARLGEVKVRAAVGWSGRAPGVFDAERTWNTVPSGGAPAFTPRTVGDPDIGPERTREIEFGFDAAWLDNRLTTAFTWYEQRTTDAIFLVRQPPSLGFEASQPKNVGAMRNRGVELALTGIVYQGPQWGLELGTSIYTNRSLVLDLGEAVPFAAGGGWVEEGFPIMAAKGIRIKNPDALAEPDTACVASVDPCAIDGEYIFGPQQPTLVWGMSATVRLPRGILLSARGEYQGGAWIQDGASFNALSRSVLWPTCTRAYGVLNGGGTEDQLTARERLECVPANTDTDYMWFPQDFFKLRDVTLTIPVGSLIRQASSATLSLSAQNFVRWRNDELRLFDPEMVGRDSLNEQNRDISEHIPAPAIFTASLRVTF